MANGSAARNTSIALSVALHGSFFWLYGDVLLEQGGVQEAELPAVVVSLIPTPAAQPAKSSPQSALENAVEPVVPAKPQPEPRPVARPEPQATLVDEVTEPMETPSEPMPASAQAQVADTPAETSTEQTVSMIPVDAAAEVIPSVPRAATDIHELAQKRQQYLGLLQSCIAAHKYYPAMARRRGVEGEVEVSFVLLSDGDARDIRVHGGPGMLRSAARRAVKQALRLPPPPEEIATPLQVQYAMNFSLR